MTEVPQTLTCRCSLLASSANLHFTRYSPVTCSYPTLKSPCLSMLNTTSIALDNPGTRSRLLMAAYTSSSVAPSCKPR
jgi:hypothetical protein